MNFNSTNAIKTLRTNAVEIQKLGSELHEKRIRFVLKKAALMDAERAARGKLFRDNPVKASFCRDWMKLQVAQEQKEHDILQEEIRDLKERMDVTVECNNALKMSYRITELEIKNML